MTDKTWRNLICYTWLIVMGSVYFVKFHHRKPAPECKICHCHKTLCARECSEESMCAMQCQRLCDRRKQ